MAWTDILEVVVDPHVAAGDMKTTFTGLHPRGVGDNLVVKAHRILADLHDLPGLHLHLRKNLPMGGGMGGGCSDGTYALLAINDVCELGLSWKPCLPMRRNSKRLPFFVDSVPAMVTGRGEHVAPWASSCLERGVGRGRQPRHPSPPKRLAGSRPRTEPPLGPIGHHPLAQWHPYRNDFESGAVERHLPLGPVASPAGRRGIVRADDRKRLDCLGFSR